MGVHMVDDTAIVGEVDVRSRGWVGIEEPRWNNESTAVARL